MLGINTNLSSINAQRVLSGTGLKLDSAMERLTSGLRINSAKDDAAGLAIADRFTAQIRGLNQAVRNANDGISLSQTAEGALQESTNILQRMRELSIQSANDTNTASDRASLQKEVLQLQTELNRIANTTTFNGKTLLDGSFGTAYFQVGSEANQYITVTTGDTKATSIGTQRLTTELAAGSIADAVLATGNNVGAQTLTVSGSVGISTVAVVEDASARDIAIGVNSKSDETGVSAKAITYAKIDSVATTGSVTFNLFGQNESDPVTVSASISATTDLTELAKAINDVSGKTGVSAVLSDSKDAVLLSNTEGYDITLTNATGSQTFTLTGVKEAGSQADPSQGGTIDFFATAAIVDTGEAVAAGASATVGGQVIFDSAKAYAVSSSADTGLFAAAATAYASDLKDVGSIDISSRDGAALAIDRIDSALSYIDDLRADFGAVQNRLSSTISNLQNVSQNFSASRSRIQDADFAMETANLSKAQVLQQAGIAMLAQANQSSQQVLQLLQG